jgi:hypothetical protein
VERGLATQDASLDIPVPARSQMMAAAYTTRIRGIKMNPINSTVGCSLKPLHFEVVGYTEIGT